MADSGSELCPVQSVVLGHKSKSNSFFSAPGLFVGLNFKVASDSDSVRSPTSPLELRVFSNLSNSVGSPKSSHDGHRRSWGCSKVGLGIVDSLDDDNKLSGKALGSFERKNIIFGPQVRTKNQTPNLQIDTVFPQAGPRSLPKNCPNFPPPQLKTPSYSSEVLFEIGEPLEFKPSKKSGACSLDSPRFVSASYGAKGRSFFHSTNPFVKKVTTNGDSEPQDKTLSADISTPASITVPVPGIIESLSASEIELSEDYTRVISHGENPKTTHIFGDCILECHSDDLNNLNNLNKNEMNEIGAPLSIRSSLDIPPLQCQPIDFLSFCYFCNKKLESGKDIYIYRGEKAFCSSDCRYQEIMIEEEPEKPISEIFQHSSTSGDGKEEIQTHGTIFE
ncbi:hypothetical protein IC575_007969 [Cucumis melo]|uniref:FCS-Like Zinc finger 10 n=1 Tax=Cucumis melo TaxID=3656 RepID=A0A1S3CR32_CUCME|nr:FCS-Like Zinc finger 10 [Cucumis melo]XP_050939610.1 FCS-Like Zinc finger 10 [Cucumis melo]